MLSMSLSVMDASLRKGQYSQICDSQRMRRVFAAERSDSEISWLKVGFWAGRSSSSFSGIEGAPLSRDWWERWSSSHMRRRMVPRRWMVEPKFGGRREAISRRMRVASLQPLLDVVMPIWRGPSEWVEGRLKVQRLGASITLMGIRFRLHSVKIWVRRSDNCLLICGMYTRIFKYAPRESFPPRVTKTASTTLSTSLRPRVVKSSSSKLRLIHSTPPASILSTRA